MNANFGLLPSLKIRGGKELRRKAMVERALVEIDHWKEKVSL